MNTLAQTGAGSTFFGGFFDWIAGAWLWGWSYFKQWVQFCVDFWSDTAQGAYDILTNIREAFLDALESLFGWLLDVLEWCASLPGTLWGMWRDAFLDSLGAIMLWLVDFVPDTSDLDLSAVQFVVGHVKSFGYFVPYGDIVIVLFVGFGIVFSIEIGKVIWRTVPGLG